ncbi:hypothetical protein DPMN_057517 [Dreissena polymorpha]|uniref:Uncharacterized protein n=1 Tax=Dreissena polymorpha TaxID=45954 RepID=A0A9D4HEY3_DREPO|nr:hypothetical protein DPMN_057517 [Dreissena polymorpha]
MAIESQLYTTRGQIVGRIATLEWTQSDIKGESNKTQAQIATLEQKVAATQNNTKTLQSRVQSLEWTQVDLNLKTRGIESQVETTREQTVIRIETLEKTQSHMNGAAYKTQAQIAIVEQKVAATQSNTYSLQSRVQS